MSGWRKRTISDMAREAQLPYFYQTGEIANLPQLEAFAALVREGEREKWMERTAILIRGEREACAKVCETIGNTQAKMNAAWRNGCRDAAIEIRARGQP